ncbi:hypothetical protein HDV05_000229, partial [Chytridiales sp. JEL 0842]
MHHGTAKSVADLDESTAVSIDNTHSETLRNLGALLASQMEPYQQQQQQQQQQTSISSLSDVESCLFRDLVCCRQRILSFSHLLQHYTQSEVHSEDGSTSYSPAPHSSSSTVLMPFLGSVCMALSRATLPANLNSSTPSMASITHDSATMSGDGMDLGGTDYSDKQLADHHHHHHHHHNNTGSSVPSAAIMPEPAMEDLVSFDLLHNMDSDDTCPSNILTFFPSQTAASSSIHNHMPHLSDPSESGFSTRGVSAGLEGSGSVDVCDDDGDTATVFSELVESFT